MRGKKRKRRRRKGEKRDGEGRRGTHEPHHQLVHRQAGKGRGEGEKEEEVYIHRCLLRRRRNGDRGENFPGRKRRRRKTGEKRERRRGGGAGAFQWTQEEEGWMVECFVVHLLFASSLPLSHT